MTDAKRHHFLPKFYLEGFSREGWVWLFDRPRGEFRRQRTKQVAVIGRYYSVATVDGPNPAVVERLLGSIEAGTRPLIEKLDAGELLDPTDKDALSVFVASMYSRVPQFRNDYEHLSAELLRRMSEIMLGDPERAALAIENMRLDTGEDLDIDPQRLSDFVTRGEYDVEFPPEHSIKMMLELIPEFGRLFEQMNWIFCHPPARSSFVTTDAPFLLIPPPQERPDFFGVGVLTPGAQKILPLSQRTCVVMGDHGSAMQHCRLNREQTRELNLNIATRAYELVIGRDEALIRNLVKRTRLMETSPARRFVVR